MLLSFAASYLSQSGLLAPLPVLAIPRIVDAAPWLLAAPLGQDVCVLLFHRSTARFRHGAPPRSLGHPHVHPCLPEPSLLSPRD